MINQYATYVLQVFKLPKSNSAQSSQSVSIKKSPLPQISEPILTKFPVLPKMTENPPSYSEANASRSSPMAPNSTMQSGVGMPSARHGMFVYRPFDNRTMAVSYMRRPSLPRIESS
ncbi:hypothetical protein DPMN_136564 [Dreissena polymorpha]|uniref:Uncharacterized protein n=1 Tax=Dreissena polymorpha TaxID=45954 RepID=A0A9D4G3K1_DREPO|nr:hypothetical protein DPMN_136564 [Dreissena polymorpha]